MIDVVMKEDGVMLNEVVAIGYGSAKKGDLAGSVAKVDMEELNKTPVASFDQALGGRVAGVQVVSGDGRPGAAANIVIRGSNTVSDNSDGSPLYVIDGVVTKADDDMNYYGKTQSVLSTLNPEDIESMTILTGPSAAALYGSDASNGVILITTKKGTVGKVQISYSNSTSFSSPMMMPKFQNIYGCLLYTSPSPRDA